MIANKKRISLITLILTVALMFSLFSVSVFAETETGAESSTPVASESVAESTPAESTPAESTGSESTPAASTTKPVASTTSGTDAEAKDMTGTIVSLSILAVIVIVITLFCIIKREKVGKFFRSLKSEFKKVVWLSWEQVRKNTVVVIIVVVIVAVVIGVLDWAFSQGIINLGKLVK